MQQPNQKTPLMAKGPAPVKDEKMDKIKTQVDDIKQVMHNNIEAALQRGDDLDALNDKSASLESESRVFKNRSQVVRRRFCVSYYRTIFVIFLVVATVIGLIVWYATS